MKKICACGCSKEIIMNKWTKKFATYYKGHRKNSFSWNKWFQEHKDDKIFCQCNCGQTITIQRYHKHYGFPKYLKGHLPKGHPEIMRKIKQVKKQNKDPVIIAKIRKSSINYLNDVRNIKYPCIGRYEEKIIDTFEEHFNYSIKRQYQVAGFYVDGYCPALNIVIEIDEKFHNKQREADIERENIIKETLHCDILRIKI